MEKVEFTPEGLFSYKWSSKQKKYIRKKVKRRYVLTFLRTACEIQEGTTLKDIFNVIDNYKLLKTVISQYAWCYHIEKFHAQVNEEKQELDDIEELDYLEVYWHVDHQNYKGETSFDISTGFHGIGSPPKDDKNYPNKDEKINYSISCTPMSNLANLPVKLKTEFKVFDVLKIGEKRLEKPKEIISTTRDYTLLEVLDAIYWDISFYGGPEQNEKFLKEMKETMDEIKSGEVLGIPIEQVLKRISNEPVEERKDGDIKIILHPDVAKAFGVDPDSIPMDDKELPFQGEE